MDATTVIILIFAGLLGLLVLSFWISFLLVKRTACKLVKTLHHSNAIHPTLAMSLDEFSLTRRTLFRITRDYRPYALQLLRQTGIIQVTPDSRIYLWEAALKDTPGLACRLETRPA